MTDVTNPAVKSRTGAMRALVAVAIAATLSACAWLLPRPAGVGPEVAWSRLPGWESDHQSETWQALLNGCVKLPGRDPAWVTICEAAQALPPNPDDSDVRKFFEQRFRAHEMIGPGGHSEGLITGYYEPVLYGSLTRDARFRYPLYRRPDNLVTVDLGALYPELQGKPIRGRLDGNRVIPYYSRDQISDSSAPLQGQELLWVDDPVALFMLQIQGSGLVRLTDGSMIAVGYADQNGYPYRAVGRSLVQMGALKPQDVTLQSIRAWLRDHPGQAEAVLNSNPSYVFFRLRDASLDGPLGSLQVPLTPERSVAVDPAYIPLGAPIWIDTTLPGSTSPYRRLVMAQDTGGAIKGQVRADLFFGRGDAAEQLAGEMKQPGRLYVLLPGP